MLVLHAEPKPFRGIDVVTSLRAMPAFAGMNLQYCLLGSGDRRYQELFLELARRHPSLMVDCSHGNSDKRHERQIEVVRDVAAQLAVYSQLAVADLDQLPARDEHLAVARERVREHEHRRMPAALQIHRAQRAADVGERLLHDVVQVGLCFFGQAKLGQLVVQHQLHACASTEVRAQQVERAPLKVSVP